MPSGLARVEGRTVISSEGDAREVDAIIFGTGFEVSHPPIAKRIHCTTGETLAERFSRDCGRRE